jgi:hypothetical protein
VAKMHMPQSLSSSLPDAESWEIEALGRHGVAVVQRMEQLKTQAGRLAGQNDGRCFLLLLEERLLNDLVVDMTSAFLDLERVASHIEGGRYKVGETHTDLYRAIVH